jgi:hypothetical protein
MCRWVSWQEEDEEDDEEEEDNEWNVREERGMLQVMQGSPPFQYSPLPYAPFHTHPFAPHTALASSHVHLHPLPHYRYLRQD